MSGTHPCQYSPEVIAVLDELIHPGEHIHDPFAGPGRRLGHLCDWKQATFSGTDIEEWPDHDPRVRLGDATHPASYPIFMDFTIITSPVYVNKRLADYSNGPTSSTKIKGRRDYALSLGRPLHPDNLARRTGRRSKVDAYWQGHRDAVKHWGDRVIVNVDYPIAADWARLLDVYGYRVEDPIGIPTQRYRGLANDRIRAELEVVLVAIRTDHPDVA
jgi:hypothetical protein